MCMKQQSKLAMLISGLPGKGSFAVPVSADNVASYPYLKLQDRAFAILDLNSLGLTVPGRPDGRVCLRWFF